MVSVGATIVGIALVQLANGFLGTVVSMSIAAMGFTPAVMGVVLAAYYGGYTIGAATIGGILQRVGHIRLFAALAGLVAACVALLPVLTPALAWISLRLLMGFGCAGLFITAESWLNATSSRHNRGSVFAIYMVATNAAFGLGQFLINIPAPGGFELFSLGAAIFCVALLPVALTRATAPKLVPGPRLRLRELRDLAPVSFAGCAMVGLSSSAFYSLVPAYAQTQGVPTSFVSVYIATAIFGGLCFQIPVGWLSDRFDRRVVAAALAGCLSVTALCLAVFSLPSFAIMTLTFLLGGFMFTVYPVCVAHANDRVEPEKVVSVSGQLILIHGIASFLGPIIGTLIMGRSGMAGVFLFMAVNAVWFIVVSTLRSMLVVAPKQKERPFIILSQDMSQPIAHVLDEQEIVDSVGGTGHDKVEARE
jgi:MFS family permease